MELIIGLLLLVGDFSRLIGVAYIHKYLEAYKEAINWWKFV